MRMSPQETTEFHSGQNARRGALNASSSPRSDGTRRPLESLIAVRAGIKDEIDASGFRPKIDPPKVTCATCAFYIRGLSSWRHSRRPRALSATPTSAACQFMFGHYDAAIDSYRRGAA